MGLRKWIRSRFGKSTPEPEKRVRGIPYAPEVEIGHAYDVRSVGTNESELDLINVGIGIAIGEALSNDASSSDSSDTSPSSDDYSGGGGDFGGGGASGDW
jgi:uncharacterized membrane protein YgcG